MDRRDAFRESFYRACDSDQKRLRFLLSREPGFTVLMYQGEVKTYDAADSASVSRYHALLRECLGMAGLGA